MVDGTEGAADPALLPSGAWDDIPVGKYLGEHRVRIDAEIVERFSAGACDRHPWYTGPSPWGFPVAPALVAGHEPWRHAGWYPPELRGNLHIRQEWDLFQPIPVGAEVSSRALIVDRYVRRDRRVFVNQVTLEHAGVPLAVGRTHQSFLLAQPEGEVVDRNRERSPERRFSAGAGEVIARLEGEWVELTPEICLAAADGLQNYHSDAEIARAFGFPGVVVQGIHHCNLVSALMTERFGIGWWCGGQLRMNLVNVAWGGDRIRAQVTLREIRDEDPRRRVECEAWVEKEDGTITAIGSTSAVLPGAGGPTSAPPDR